MEERRKSHTRFQKKKNEETEDEKRTTEDTKTEKKRCKKKVTKKRRVVYRISKIDDKGIMTNFKSSRKSTRISTKRGYVTKFHKGT